jgi:hypothetical protein
MPPVSFSANGHNRDADPRSGGSQRAVNATGQFRPVTFSDTARTPERAGASRAPMPFVWQHGTQLILLDDDSVGWVMAELRFDSDLCRYVEVRRAVYDLTREAIGAVISRALASGDHAAVDTALCLHDWLQEHYGIAVVSDVLPPPDAGSYEYTL